jgi:hypothetical protein
MRRTADVVDRYCSCLDSVNSRRPTLKNTSYDLITDDPLPHSLDQSRGPTFFTVFLSAIFSLLFGIGCYGRFGNH